MKRTPINAFRRNLPSIGLGAVLGVLVSTCSQPKSPEANGPVKDTITSVGNRLSPTPAFARATVAEDGPATLTEVAEQVVPSVVNISTTRTVKARPSPFQQNPFFREFFGPFGGPHRAPRERQESSLGSGVIVTEDGVILTNNHVVAQADEVQVTLSDGRELEAEVVGTDPQSDVAVVKLKGEVPENLQPLRFGDSSALRLGEVVLAVGNPFGVGQTVTMGIVSATGRSQVGIVDYEDFIQTDAAINPGNSGGALVNMRGELVGVNTAILSRTGGYQGIGFAIPSDMARPIMESLVTTGKVSRGWLGVGIQDLDRDLAAAMELKVEQGVLLSDVMPGSPAAKAGLKRGDVVVAVDGQAITSSGELRNRIAAKAPGTEVALTLVRDGKQKVVNVTLGALAESPAAKAEVERDEGVLSGLEVSNLTPSVRDRYEVPKRVADGVVVTGVQQGSPAARVGLREGDVILEMNRKRVTSVDELRKLNRQAEGSVLLLVSRQGNTIYLALRK